MGFEQSELSLVTLQNCSFMNFSASCCKKNFGNSEFCADTGMKSVLLQEHLYWSEEVSMAQGVC